MKNDLLEKYFTSKVKVEAVSIQSIIVGSVIMGVIAAAGLATIWGSVDKAKIVAEKATIGEMTNAFTAAKEENSGVIFDILSGGTVDDYIKDSVQSVPSDLKYKIYSVYTIADNKSAGSLVAYGTDEAGKAKIRSIVTELEAFYDVTASATAGKFQYDATCGSATDGSDCFYKIHISNGGLANSSTLWSPAIVTATFAATVDSTAVVTQNAGAENVSWVALN